jgi:hypothetical protein
MVCPSPFRIRVPEGACRRVGQRNHLVEKCVDRSASRANPIGPQRLLEELLEIRLARIDHVVYGQMRGRMTGQTTPVVGSVVVAHNGRPFRSSNTR